MRYRIGESPEQPGTLLDQGAFSSIALLSFLIGVGFVFAGLKSRHYWLSYTCEPPSDRYRTAGER
jgi:hypothetical protein